MQACPCGSGRTAADCCAPILAGTRAAATAEELMRARYSAYVGVNLDFIFISTHPDYRRRYDPDATRAWAEKSDWLSLEIVATSGGGPADTEGTVEFIARYREGGIVRQHHESASFVRYEGAWSFTEGGQVKPKPLTVNKVGRNDPCPCGSGRKAKKCCHP